MPNDTQAKLTAFAPTGAAIRRTFEMTVGHQAVRSFFQREDGRFVHDYSDAGSDLGDPETVTFDGDVVYVDATGALWPERALTFKAENGDTVRKGLDMPPLDQPDYELMSNVGFKASALLRHRSGLAENDWHAAANAQGWDRDSQIIHLEGFIRGLGLMPAFAAYAAIAAAEESAHSVDLG